MNHTEFLEESATKFDAKFLALNKAIVGVLEDYSMVQMLPLNIKRDESVGRVMMTADSLVQYGEQEEPQDKDEPEEPDDVEMPRPEPTI